MIVLHIACTNGDPSNGVQVVVPQHLIAQSTHAEVAIVNISNIKVYSNCVQFEYNDQFSVAALPIPFNKPDIVVFHECYRIQYIRIAGELRKMQVPYVIVPHGELSKDAQKKKRLKKLTANMLIFNRFINRAIGIQMLSDMELNNTKFGKHKFIGTNGINIPEISKQQFHQLAIKFVYIGRLDAYHKGLDLMVEGVSQCADFLRSNMCAIDIYGPDILERRKYIEGLIAEYNVGDLIIMHDPIFGKDKERVLLEGDIFIQTSRFEGMPMGILEALSYGIPCLVTEGTTLASFIEEHNAGWSCATNAEDIAQAIRTAVSQKGEYMKKSKNARRAVCEYFSWDVISSATISIYKKLIKNIKSQ